jgi:GAF domain-containing protein
VSADSLKLIRDEARLDALRATGLLDTPKEEAFDRFCRLASTLLHVPTALVSLVDAERLFFKASVGLSEPWASQRSSRLNELPCQHVVATAETLAIKDTRQGAALRGRPAIRALKGLAYLGAPIITPDAHTIGTFCVVSEEPREWEPNEIWAVQEFANAVMTEIKLRAKTAETERAVAELATIRALNPPAERTEAPEPRSFATS